MNWLRRILLELWAVFLIAAVVGYLGPFGTYLNSRVADRVADWWMLLMGAYLFVRPWILVLRWVAGVTLLPSRILVLWGVVATSAPLAMVWREIGQDAFRQLDGYAALVPFALLSALAVLAAERWAAGANDRIASQHVQQSYHVQPAIAVADKGVRESEAPFDDCDPPPLVSRLDPTFEGPVVALQSEDHYVRVHGARGSELLLMRLRDAIAEMGNVSGEQIHRSWWVAYDGISGVDQSGRNWSVRLKSGLTAPVARDSVPRLRKCGILPVEVLTQRLRPQPPT